MTELIPLAPSGKLFTLILYYKSGNMIYHNHIHNYLRGNEKEVYNALTTGSAFTRREITVPEQLNKIFYYFADDETVIYHYTKRLLEIIDVGEHIQCNSWALIDLSAYFLVGDKDGFDKLFLKVLSGDVQITGTTDDFYRKMYKYYDLDNKNLFVYMFRWFVQAINKGSPERILLIDNALSWVEPYANHPKVHSQISSVINKIKFPGKLRHNQLNDLFVICQN